MFCAFDPAQCCACLCFPVVRVEMCRKLKLGQVNPLEEGAGWFLSDENICLSCFSTLTQLQM